MTENNGLGVQTTQAEDSINKKYSDLSKLINELFNPIPVDGKSEYETIVVKLKKISNFIQEIQCTCVYDSIEGHTVCKRCELLGRFEDEPV